MAATVVIDGSCATREKVDGVMRTRSGITLGRTQSMQLIELRKKRRERNEKEEYETLTQEKKGVFF